MSYSVPVEPGKKVRLAAIDPAADGGLSKADGVQRTAELTTRLADLQQELYAASVHSLLVVLQGMDTSGKDGTIRKVFSSVNPQGCQVTSFKAPNEVELDHDFLWRVHRRTPANGMIGVFNRSHYEDVLIVRVHELVPRKVWKQRYQQINDFERLLGGLRRRLRGGPAPLQHPRGPLDDRPGRPQVVPRPGHRGGAGGSAGGASQGVAGASPEAERAAAGRAGRAGRAASLPRRAEG